MKTFETYNETAWELAKKAKNELVEAGLANTVKIGRKAFFRITPEGLKKGLDTNQNFLALVKSFKMFTRRNFRIIYKDPQTGKDRELDVK